MEAHRIRHAQRDELAVDQCLDRIRHVAGRHRHVPAQPERVELVDEHLIARLYCAGLVLDVLELRPWELIERPALRTVAAVGDGRAVERASAFLAVEACHVAARERHPHHAVAVDVAAARTEAAIARARIVVGHLVIFGERRRGRIVARNDARHAARHRQHRAPDRAVVGIDPDAIHAGEDAFVL